MKKDVNQLAKEILDIATGDKENKRGDKPQAKGGRKGGKARAEKLTAEQRKAIAKKAAEKRWGTKEG